MGKLGSAWKRAQTSAGFGEKRSDSLEEHQTGDSSLPVKECTMQRSEPVLLHSVTMPQSVIYLGSPADPKFSEPQPAKPRSGFFLSLASAVKSTKLKNGNGSVESKGYSVQKGDNACFYYYYPTRSNQSTIAPFPSTPTGTSIAGFRLLLPIPIKRTISDGPRGPQLAGAPTKIDVPNSLGLTPAASSERHLAVAERCTDSSPNYSYHNAFPKAAESAA